MRNYKVFTKSIKKFDFVYGILVPGQLNMTIASLNKQIKDKQIL